MSDLIEDFYGVYLLLNVGKTHAGCVYIGFTTDPNRRIIQHNKGILSGGARKTHSKGPWKMVLITHGFPNDISALRFEWAWQNPEKSRRLRHLPTKKSKEKAYDFALRILCEMLRTKPWSRLPLTVRWMDDEYTKDFPINLMPPLHMPIVFGDVSIKKLVPESYPRNDEEIETEDDDVDNGICFKCGISIADKQDLMTCITPKCDLVCHIICFSSFFLHHSDDKNTGQVIPLEGVCPRCKIQLLWGDLVRKKKGCYASLIDDKPSSSFELLSEDLSN